MNGTICSENWDNTDADVLCRQLGYSGGVAFGPQYSGSSTPMWMSNVQCNGTEKSVQSCKFDMTPSNACLSNHMSARTYCYDGEGKDQQESTVFIPINAHLALQFRVLNITLLRQNVCK